MGTIQIRNGGKFTKGHKHSPEIIEKIRKTHTGMFHSDESKKKISEAKKGSSAWNKGLKLEYKSRPNMLGKVPWNKAGIEVSCKTCKKNFAVKPSRATKAKFCSRNCAFSGKNNHNWKGGITPENYKIRHSLQFKKWRIAIFERDNYTCVNCNTRGGILHPDHIKPFAYFPELRFDLDNGRTLCVDCHKKTDTFGYKACLNYYE